MGERGGGKYKGLLRSKRRWDWCKFIFKDLIKVHLLGFLALGFSLLVDKFGSPGSGPDPHIGGVPDPDPGVEMNADPYRSGPRSSTLRVARCLFLSKQVFIRKNGFRTDYL